MKVLLDEDIDHRLRKTLPSHEVFTVRYLGWSGLENGQLLSAAEQHGIDIFVTADQTSAINRILVGAVWPSLFFQPPIGPSSNTTLRRFQQPLTGLHPGLFNRWSAAGSAGSASRENLKIRPLD